ncbi:hypothetical protein OIU84_017995 [Salix udensis]|uniref:Amidase domain-containing protein n=1 Tax=Salix udensis TaxID=889485 RepID=A0AAD6PMF4_9ROSI|nr:hypothetical protein OIU84_017995 [Salix udensis]
MELSRTNLCLSLPLQLMINHCMASLFAVKDIFDVEGYVTGFGNPDWARTHSAATSTAPAVLAVLGGGATCVGKTVMDEMAYSINGENIHYGTPINPCAPDRVPGGSSSGSAVAVGAKLVDFSLGTDTGGSVRVPASYCGILGFRPSHDAVPSAGVIPMAQSFDTVGWFARDPVILSQEDLFQLSIIPNDRLGQVLVKSVEKIYGGHIVKHMVLGDYVRERVPTLSNVLRSLQRYEFKDNHGEWITAVKPELGPGISERAALATLLQDFGILAIPTVPGPPPKLQTDPTTLEIFRAKAFSLLSIAGVSGFCQVSIPLGMYENLPVAVSLLAKQGSDAFLLNVVESLYGTLKEQVEITGK